MKLKIYLFAILLFFCLRSWAQNFAKEKTIALNSDFSLHLSKGEDFGNFSTYSTLFVFHAGKRVFSDTTREYEFGDRLYPIINKLNTNSYEILLEVNDRPNKNYLMHIMVSNNKIVKKSKLPTFIARAADLAGNKTLEYAGFWGYSEIWGDHNELTDYNPILYYKVTKDGIKIDTVLTIQKNTAIYGKFRGFEDDTNKPVPVTTAKKFAAEIKRIESLTK
ncbi:MAG: hypothetical protein JWP94_435 [Mucilaginibacter sp.]|jgi:hypothetical protein|nr:hypothetical protein [Mucilaginibacter sp.]